MPPYNAAIMQAISQQPEEDQLSRLKAEARGEAAGVALVTVHQLDCTYYGELNKSYQKEGIGVLLTLAFQGYFGFWKNNRPEGRGLLLFPSGELVFGEFNRSALAGPAVVDDGKFLRVGVFEGVDMQGVGFEYTYPTSKWRMLRYVRGSPAEQLREEVLPLAEGLPGMLAAQHSLHQLLADYREARFFAAEPRPKKGRSAPEERHQRLNAVMVSSRDDLLAVGFRDEGGLHGLAAILNRREQTVVEAGFYIGGQLEGYALESPPEASYRQFGPFFAGVKHGAFVRVSSRGTEVVEFSEGREAGESAVTEEQAGRRQRSFNFEQKDFLSARNTIDFDHLYELFTPPEARHRRSKQPHDLLVPDLLPPEPRAPPRRSGDKRQPVAKERGQHGLSGEMEGEKSCVDMIRQKLSRYDMVRSERSARVSSEERRRHILDSNLRVLQEEEEAIAEQENPFDSALRGVNLLHESPKRRH